MQHHDYMATLGAMAIICWLFFMFVLMAVLTWACEFKFKQIAGFVVFLAILMGVSGKLINLTTTQGVVAPCSMLEQIDRKCGHTELDSLPALTKAPTP